MKRTDASAPRLKTWLSFILCAIFQRLKQLEMLRRQPQVDKIVTSPSQRRCRSRRASRSVLTMVGQRTRSNVALVVGLHGELACLKRLPAVLRRTFGPPRTSGLMVRCSRVGGAGGRVWCDRCPVWSWGHAGTYNQAAGPPMPACLHTGAFNGRPSGTPPAVFFVYKQPCGHVCSENPMPGLIIPGDHGPRALV